MIHVDDLDRSIELECGHSWMKRDYAEQEYAVFFEVDLYRLHGPVHLKSLPCSMFVFVSVLM